MAKLEKTIRARTEDVAEGMMAGPDSDDVGED